LRKVLETTLPKRTSTENIGPVSVAAGAPAPRMGAKPTLGDIAQRTGLSVATISRALHRHDSPNVSHETRERVRNIAQEIGYQPNLLSRSLVSGRTHIVSYWTFDAFSPYYASVGRDISWEASRRGYLVHIHNTLNPAGGLESDPLVMAGEALAMSFDGIIACDVAYPGNRYADQLHRPGVPLVGIGFNHPTDCDFVNLDLAYGATLAVQHLLSLGCRRIAFMGQDSAVRPTDLRARTYSTILQESGLETEWIPIRGHRRNLARTAIGDYVSENGLPEAIFCINDEVAVGCCRGLADIGIEVPRDVLLVGFDGIVETEYQRCPITTVAAPLKKMCVLAWDFLEDRLREPDRPYQQVVLKPELVIRESTRGTR
jgi:LacI family transcriptional regulator